MKYILVIGDGMADDPVIELGGKTPLQFADIATMDYLAEHGELGSVFNVPEGLPAGSDTAILSIMGCDPNFCYTGRAPLEAAATGIKLEPGDAAYRCNMVAYEDSDKPFFEKKILSHNAGSIEGQDSYDIITWLMSEPEFSALSEKAHLIVNRAYSFRHIAVQKADIKGIRLIPPHDHLGEVIGPLMPSGCENAKVLLELMELAHKKLDRHPINMRRRAEGKLPANGIWFWAEGTAVALPNFIENYGKSGGVISAVPLCHGIAALAGLKMISVEGATGELETNYEGKARAALEALKSDDFVAIHVEAPDECTHNGDLKGKIQAIENIDKRVLAPLVGMLREVGYDYRMLILSDHKTLTSTRGHDGGAVPYILYDSRKENGSKLPYSEENGLRGRTVSAGVALMSMLFEVK
ncbi:MAG: 2,3-bisphosphoglycerate-independent phosphoglycerate mutase [Oscillospiraceae bacterium]